jgi:hypothetical protein
VGLDGRFGDSSWTWDGYYQWGESKRNQLVAQNRHLNAYNFAADAVFDDRPQFAALPPTQRPIECRITQQIRNGTVPVGTTQNNLLIAQGCVPLNPFGNAPIRQLGPMPSALNEDTTEEQQVLAFNTTGDLFSGWCGRHQGRFGCRVSLREGHQYRLPGRCAGLCAQ